LRFCPVVEFIDEDDARSALFGLAKHVANAGRSDTDKHFNEIAAT
jgi:hypothetical protein